MTPRELSAWRQLGLNREKAEEARRFITGRMAAHADKKGSEEFLDDLLDED